MRARRALFVAVALLLAAFAACTLNPQPLPPFDEDNNAGGGNADAGRPHDAGAMEPGRDGAETPPAPEPDDAGLDADADAAPDDAGVDAGDAATDADPD
jgi:hypothetical protein